MKSIPKIIKRVLLVLLILILSIIIGFFAVLAFNSPGTIESYIVEGENKIAEKTRVEIGGISQGMFIAGEDMNNPVILFLHGGPGSPEESLLLPMERNKRLEQFFTVCYWNQRGAGISYNSKLTAQDMTLEQMVDDSIEVANYLRKRFNQEKIMLMGHSWGSFLGVHVVQKQPEIFNAYVGIGQVTNQEKSEKIAYDYMIELATSQNDTKALKKLNKFRPDEFGRFEEKYIMGGTRTMFMEKYRIGLARKKGSINIISLFTFFKGYTFVEKLNFINAVKLSNETLFDDVLETNLFEKNLEFKLPFYVVQGKYDYQVSQTLAKQYLDEISAPKKEFFSFENSAHSPNAEEGEKFVSTIQKIYNENK